MQFLIDGEGPLQVVILNLIGLAIGTMIFSGLWLLVFLWRKVIMRALPGVYEGSKPGRFSLWFSGSIAIVPVAIIFQQSLQSIGVVLEFIPFFVRIWIYVILGFLIATTIILICDFSKRKKPNSKISEAIGAVR